MCTVERDVRRNEATIERYIQVEGERRRNSSLDELRINFQTTGNQVSSSIRPVLNFNDIHDELNDQKNATVIN